LLNNYAQDIYLIETKANEKSIPDDWIKNGGTKVSFLSFRIVLLLSSLFPGQSPLERPVTAKDYQNFEGGSGEPQPSHQILPFPRL
jgi:hypothetical protein